MLTLLAKTGLLLVIAYAYTDNDQSKNRYAGTQSNLVGGTKGNPAAKKHAGIRSLLGADNVSNDSPTSSSTKSQSLEQTAGMSLMDRLKNNIEDAINQHDSDLHAEAKKSQMHQGSGPGLSNASFHHDKSGIFHNSPVNMLQ